MFASGTPSGQATTGNWVSDGLTFFFIAPDPSAPIIAGNLRAYNLGVVTVHLQVGLTASPNPIPVQAGSIYGQTTLYWNAPGHSALQVRIGSPTGPLFAAGAPSGKATTGNWVTDGLKFYLIDPNTSATVSVFTARLGSAPTVGTNVDGRLEMFTLGSDGAIWRNAQASPNCSWSGWTSMGGSFTAAPTVGVNSDGRLELFGRGIDGAIWDASQQTPGGSWSGWTSLGGYLTSPPSVAANADGRLEIFAVGGDNATIWHDAQSTPGSSAWTNWFPIGGISASLCPSVALNANGELQLFAVSTSDAAVWTAAQQTPGAGAWSGWTSLGGYLTSTPSIGTDLDGRLEIFAVGADKATLFGDAQSSPGGGWAGWIPFYGISTSLSPSVARNSDGRLEIFEMGTDGTAWHAGQQNAGGAWTGWVSLGGTLSSLPSVVSNSYGALEIVAEDALSNILTNFQTTAGGSWSDWLSSSYPIPSPGGVNPCNNITGTWVESSNPTAYWHLTQNGAALSGTVYTSNGSYCGTVTWAFQGQMLSPASELFSLTAYNPSQAVDSCGYHSNTSIAETLTLGGVGCSSGSANWTSTAGSNTGSGTTTWRLNGNQGLLGSPHAILSGSMGVPLNGTSQFTFQVTPAVGPVNLYLRTTTGSGSAVFSNGSSSMIISGDQPQTFTVQGTGVSSTADNILLDAEFPGGQGLAEKTLTVVWVNVTMQTTPNQPFAADNSAGSVFATRYGSVLGPAIVDPPGGGKFCANVVQYTGTVTPSNYKGMIYLNRKLLGAAQWANSSLALHDPKPDPPPPGVEDVDPQSGGSNGKVYDLDAPGFPPFEPDVVYRWRANFAEYAVLDKLDSNSSIVSDQLPAYTRYSCKGISPPVFLSADDPAAVSGDNQAGVGATPLTWNLQ